MRRHILVALLASWSCATTSAPPVANELSLRSDDVPVEARVGRESFVGEAIQLERSKDVLKGQAFGRDVDLTWESGRVSGVMNDQPVDVTVQLEAETRVAKGRWGDRPIEVQLSASEVHASVGGCQLDLAKAERSYEGVRACGDAEALTTLTLPDLFWELPRAEAMAMLLVVLSAEG